MVALPTPSKPTPTPYQTPGASHLSTGPASIESIRRLLAKGQATYAPSEKTKKTRETRKLNREKSQAEAEALYAEQTSWSWRRLPKVSQINEGLRHLRADGPCSDFTWMFSDHVLKLLRSKPREKQLAFVMDRIRKPLNKALGRKIKLFMVLQKNGAGFEHLHGLADIAMHEKDLVEEVLGRAAVLGIWRAKDTRKQFQVRPTPDRGWIGYSVREFEELRRGDYYASHAFTAAAKRRHKVRRLEVGRLP